MDRGDAELLGTIPYSLDAVDKLVRKLGPKELLAVCYEAGPCGYEPYRYLRAKGIRCELIPPSRVPDSPSLGPARPLLPASGPGPKHYDGGA